MELFMEPLSLSQARRSGKLVEMRVDERVSSLVESWAQQLSLSPLLSASDVDDSSVEMSEEEVRSRVVSRQCRDV